MTSNVAQRSPRWLNMVSNVPQEASTPTQNGPNWPRGLPNKPPRGNNPSKTLGGVIAISCLARSLSTAPPRPQDGSKKAPGSPKRSPRRPQYCPKSARERSASAPIWGARSALMGASKRFDNLSPPFLFDRPPSQMAPRKPARPPKGPPKGAEEAPGGHRDAPEWPPRSDQEAPRGSSEAPKTLQETLGAANAPSRPPPLRNLQRTPEGHQLREAISSGVVWHAARSSQAGRAGGPVGRAGQSGGP